MSLFQQRSRGPRSPHSRQWGWLRLAAAALSVGGAGAYAHAALATEASVTAQTAICPDLAIANGLATGDQAASREAYARSARGDLLARDLLIRASLHNYIQSHAWYSPNAPADAARISSQLEKAAQLGDANASLTYRRILTSKYYQDLIDTSTYYAPLERRLSALAGPSRYYWKQLELRRSLEGASGRKGLWMTPGAALHDTMSRTRGPCGMLYVEEVAAAYADGVGISQNLNTAVAWYSDAAKAGIVSAQYAVGALLLDQLKQCAQLQFAIAQLQQAAFLGSVKAWTLLGRLYQKGTCVRADSDSAEQYYEEASERGSQVATFMLGRMLSGDVSSPIRWARGIMMIRSVENRIGPASWAAFANTDVYTALCGYGGGLALKTKSKLLREASNMGIVALPNGSAPPTASPEACSTARAAMTPDMKIMANRLMTRLTSEM